MMSPHRFEAAGDDRSRSTFSARDALLSWMQEIAPYGIFTTDRELRVQTWNRWLVSHSGFSAEKVIGRSITEIYPDMASRRLDEHFRRALTGEVSVLSTALHRYLLPLPSTMPDGGMEHMLQTARIAPLPAGELILGTITIVEDVTQRESQALRLQRQQEHDRVLSAALSVLLQSSDPLRDVAALFPKITLPLGLEAYFNYLYEPESKTLRLNAAGGILPKQKQSISSLSLGEGLCGHSAKEATSIIRNHLQTAEDALSESMRQFGFRSYCGFPLLIGGRLLGTLAFASSTRDVIEPDEIECVSTVAQCVAVAMERAFREQALREAQAKLREHAEMLEVKVAERTSRLRESIAQLESFTYTVAHDLRAPIRSLAGYCEILRDEYALPGEGKLIVNRLHRATQHLDALTRDLLKFSAVSQQNIQLESISVPEIVGEILQLNPEFQVAELRAKEPFARVKAHRLLLRQCLSNLFDNALKFARPGVEPSIVVWTERRYDANPGGGTSSGFAFNPAVHRNEPEGPTRPPSESSSARVRIWIEDNGIGIPPEAHEKIFGIFERGGGVNHIEGTGIGLAIVARAAHRMGGTCGVESMVGCGSRFWIEFDAGDWN